MPEFVGIRWSIQGFWLSMNSISDKTRQENCSHNFRSCQVVVIGCMDHTIDHTFESANRVYDVTEQNRTEQNRTEQNSVPFCMDVVNTYQFLWEDLEKK